MKHQNKSHFLRAEHTGLESGYRESQSLISGRFEVLRELGRGSDGVVFLVYDRLRQSRVVFKQFWDASPVSGEMHKEVLQVLSRFEHPCLPRLLDWGMDAQNRTYYTKTFVEGEPGSNLAGKLLPSQVAAIACDLAEALTIFHKADYCHGDLKPDNLLLHVSKNETRSTLIDFGFVFHTTQEDLSSRGTPHYMAPELFRGESSTQHTDLYALGATLYHLLHGKKIFEEVDPRDLVHHLWHDHPTHPTCPPHLPEDETEIHNALSQQIQGLLHKVPFKRPNNLQNFFQILSPFRKQTTKIRSSTFVGRKKESRALLSWLSEHQDPPSTPTPGCVLLGEAGSGKKKLLEQVKHKLSCLFLQHRITPASDPPLIEMLRQLLLAAPHLLGEEQGAAMEELASVFAPITSSHDGPQQQRLIRYLLKAGQESPLVLIFSGLLTRETYKTSIEPLLRALLSDQTRPPQERTRLACLLLAEEDPSQHMHTPGLLETIELPPLTTYEVATLIRHTVPDHNALTPHAQQLKDLTGGHPDRVLESLSLLRQVPEKKISKETVRTFAVQPHTPESLLESLSPSEKQAANVVNFVEEPVSTQDLQRLLPQQTLLQASLLGLVQKGILEKQEDNLYTVKNNVFCTYLQTHHPLSTQDQVNLSKRYLVRLLQYERERSKAVSELDILRWAERAEENVLICQRASVNPSRYSLQALEISHRALQKLAQPDHSSWGKAYQEVTLQLLSTSLESNRPQDLEEHATHLLRWMMRHNHLEETFAQAFLEPSTQDPHPLDWKTRLAALPYTGDSEPSSVAYLLCLFTRLSFQQGRRAEAVHRLYLATSFWTEAQHPRMWTFLLLTLAPVLWQTAHRTDLQHLIERLCAQSSLYTQLTHKERAQILNIKAGLLQETSIEQACDEYERAIYEGMRSDDVPVPVLKATNNLVKLFILKGELQVARYHARKGLLLAEQGGHTPTVYALLRSIADISQRSGRSYNALQNIEEAYRRAQSTGRKDLLCRAQLVLIHHQGEFGMIEKAQATYAKLKREGPYVSRWEPDAQYLEILLKNNHHKEARIIFDKLEKQFTKEQLGLRGQGIIRTQKADLLLHEKQHNRALHEAQLALEIALKLDAKLLIIKANRLRAEALLQTGDVFGAAQIADETDAILRDVQIRGEEPFLLHLHAQIALAQRRPLDASRYFQRAKDRQAELMAGMPAAYRTGYLKNWRRKAIEEDAEKHHLTERGFLLTGVTRILNIVQILYKRPGETLDDTLNHVLDEIIAFTRAERGIFFRLEHLSAEDFPSPDRVTILEQDWEGPNQGQRWSVSTAVARGFGHEDLDEKRARASHTVIRSVLKNRKPIWSANAVEDSRFSRSGSIAILGMRSILALPLQEEGKVVGVVYLDSSHGQQFTGEDSEILELLGNQIGPVVELAYRNKHTQDVSEAFPRIIGHSRVLMKTLSEARRIAKADVPVLITGETGTGKDLLAQGIHGLSKRSTGAFLAINCAALPENLVESELFGHIKGAFTGATHNRAGVFEQARGGTLFLDEIGDLPLTIQAKLLRVLQEQKIRRVGDNRDRDVDVRVIAATHWDLKKLAEENRFRSDLFYRLNTMELNLASLSDRTEDIPALVQFFFNLFTQQHHLNIPPIASSVVDGMKKLPWPGNIRQLRNTLLRAMLLNQGEALTLREIQTIAGEVARSQDDEVVPTPRHQEPSQPATPTLDLPAGLQALLGQLLGGLSVQTPPTHAPAPPLAPGEEELASSAPITPSWRQRTNHEHRRKMALRAIEEARGNKSRAAQALGISRRTLYRYLDGPGEIDEES